MVLAVFEDQDAVGLQQCTLEDEIGNLGQFLQRVGRVGKDNVVLLTAGLDEAEDVGTQRQAGLGAQFLHAVADETVVVAVELDAGDVGAAAREQFKRDAARTGKEVEGLTAIKVDIAIQHVKDVLLGEVGGGARLEGARYVEVATFVFSGNDSHRPFTI